MVLLRVATYWAAWCGSPRPHPLQRWGEKHICSNRPTCCSTCHHISESEPESLPLIRDSCHPEDQREHRGLCISAPGHGAWPRLRLRRADRETPLMASGGVSPREMKWRTSSPPGQPPPGHELVTRVARAGSHRCLQKAEKAGCSPGGWGLGGGVVVVGLCPRVAAGAWIDLF